MPPPNPYTLVAELSYRCPLHCPYCSNPVAIGGERFRAELETEHWARVFEEARALGVLQLALTGGEPMVRRDLDELVAAARAAGLYSTLVTAGIHFTPRAGGAPEGGRARPRAGLGPEPRPRGERPHRRHPLVREEDGRGARGARAALPADDQLRPAPPQPRSHRGDPRAGRGARRAAARAGEHAVLRLGRAQPAGADADARAARARRGGGAALPRARRPEDQRAVGPAGLLRGPAQAVRRRLGAHADPGGAERRGDALPRGVDDPRPRVPERTRAFARLDLERVGRVLAGSAAPTGCRSRAARARWDVRRRTSAAAAARRCGSPATPPRPIRCAATRRTTTPLWPPAKRPRRRTSRTARRGGPRACNSSRSYTGPGPPRRVASSTSMRTP